MQDFALAVSAPKRNPHMINLLVLASAAGGGQHGECADCMVLVCERENAIATTSSRENVRVNRLPIHLRRAKPAHENLVKGTDTFKNRIN